MSKQLRRRRAYITLAILVVLPVLMTFAIKYGGRGERREADQTDLFRLAKQSGLIMPAFALAALSGFILIIVVGIFAGDVVAGEASWGNLRYILVRPISRVRLLTAKLAIAVTFTIIATFLIAITALIAGLIAFGWHDIFVLFPPVHQTADSMLWHTFIVTAYITWEMMAVVALGFMVSTMTDAPVGAIGAAIGFGIVSEILDAIPPLGFLRYGLPLHYLNAWTDLVRGSIDPTGSTLNFVHAEMWRGVAVQVPYIIVFCAVAYWWFRRKDILS
jgi:ABC-2 type transport system permease protein